jgi:hypothetical protein
LINIWWVIIQVDNSAVAFLALWMVGIVVCFVVALIICVWLLLTGNLEGVVIVVSLFMLFLPVSFLGILIIMAVSFFIYFSFFFD